MVFLMKCPQNGRNFIVFYRFGLLKRNFHLDMLEFFPFFRTAVSYCLLFLEMKIISLLFIFQNLTLNWLCWCLQNSNNLPCLREIANISFFHKYFSLLCQNLHKTLHYRTIMVLPHNLIKNNLISPILVCSFFENKLFPRLMIILTQVFSSLRAVGRSWSHIFYRKGKKPGIFSSIKGFPAQTFIIISKQKLRMCKKSYVELKRRGKKYKLYLPDIKDAFSINFRIRPPLPKCEQPTEDEIKEIKGTQNQQIQY